MRLLTAIKRIFVRDVRLAAEKREYERYLRAHGVSKRKAVAEVAKRYGVAGGEPG